ncbi:MAG: hypothetical protein KF746_17300 [Chitinophagaceae bacterium]|nr:hypothetical protein [Chitinophagaceae bacterium]
MNSTKTLEAAGVAGIATLFIGVFLILFSLFQQMIDFILHLPAGVSHY